MSSRVGEILGISGEFRPSLHNSYLVCARGSGTVFIVFRSGGKNRIKWEFEGRFIRSDGRIIYFRTMSASVRVSDELLFSGVILDVTAEKEADNSLQSERKFSQLLLDISPVFIVAINGKGKTLMMNGCFSMHWNILKTKWRIRIT